MIIKYYGVRGSIPTPLLPEVVKQKSINFLTQILKNKDYKGLTLKDIIKKMPFHLKSTYGGNTPCLYIKIKNEHLIFDAGSGIRELGFELMKEEFGQGKGKARVFILI